tara:strand:+ start:137 stop:481 length:345 start_codon:yes stop_codon:yes gene_type:complete
MTESLYRRDASDTSIDAAESLDITRLEQMILEDIQLAGVWGMTQDDLIRMHPGYSYSSITARPASLKQKGLIFDSGERRAGRSGRGQAVLKAAKFQTLDTNDSNHDSGSDATLF